MAGPIPEQKKMVNHIGFHNINSMEYSEVKRHMADVGGGCLWVGWDLAGAGSSSLADQNKFHQKKWGSWLELLLAPAPIFFG